MKNYTNLTHEEFSLKVERVEEEQKNLNRSQTEEAENPRLVESGPWDSVAVFLFLRHSQPKYCGKSSISSARPGFKFPILPL